MFTELVTGLFGFKRASSSASGAAQTGKMTASYPAPDGRPSERKYTAVPRPQDLFRQSRPDVRHAPPSAQHQSRDRRASVMVDRQCQKNQSRDPSTSDKGDPKQKREQTCDQEAFVAEKHQSREQPLTTTTNQVTTAPAQRPSHVVTINRPKSEHLSQDDYQLTVQLRDVEAKYRILEEKNKALGGNNKILEGKSRYLEEKSKNLESYNRKLNAKVVALQNIGEHYKERYLCVMNACVIPYVNTKGLSSFNDASLANFQHVLEPLLDDALGAADLRSQVQSLQQGMLANVEKVQPINDEQFKQNFRTLAAAIKTLSRAIKLTHEVNITNIFAPCLLVSKVREEHWAARSRKKSLIEAFVWSTLMTHIFSSPFVMFGESCHPALSNIYFGMFGIDHHHGWPAPSELAERWRCATVERLVEMVDSEAFTKGFKNNADPDLQRSIQNARAEVRNAIASTLARVAPGMTFSSVDAILDKAFALALQMSLQRCRIQIVYPGIGDPFVLNQTTDLVNIPDSEDMKEGSVAFTVNPGLAKWGDGHGKNLKERLELVPAEVFVEPWIDDKMDTTESSVGLLQREDISFL